jgi:adenosylhomocysteine nucleosidase
MVIGEKCLQHDAGVITPGGRLERYQAGHVPFLNPTDQHGFFPSARVLATMRRVMADTALTPVLDRTPHVRFGTILTGDQFLRDSVTRDRFHAETGARAIEMEGAALGQVAQHLDVDHLVIRSLSDLAADDAEADFDRFLPEVSANSARLVLGLISRLEEDDGNHSIGT